jgi:hypothetical protein
VSDGGGKVTLSVGGLGPEDLPFAVGDKAALGFEGTVQEIKGSTVVLVDVVQTLDRLCPPEPLKEGTLVVLVGPSGNLHSIQRDNVEPTHPWGSSGVTYTSTTWDSWVGPRGAWRVVSIFEPRTSTFNRRNREA